MYQGTIILEGGARRGVFTSGVLDYLMEKDIYFSDVIGVSMGSCNALGYVARQPGRTRDCIITDGKDDDYINGPVRIVKERSLMDMDMIFDTFTYDTHPFDFDTYFNSGVHCEIVATNCLNGKPEYFTETHDKERLMQASRASCSLPLIGPMVTVDGIPYLDGGLIDSIPIRRAMTLGNKKIVLVLTRNYGYRKQTPRRVILKMYRQVYRHYPELVDVLMHRHQRYNRIVEKIEQLELSGQIFVIRPEIHTVSRLERSNDRLQEFYRHGYEQMQARYVEMLDFLK